MRAREAAWLISGVMLRAKKAEADTGGAICRDSVGARAAHPRMVFVALDRPVAVARCLYSVRVPAIRAFPDAEPDTRPNAGNVSCVFGAHLSRGSSPPFAVNRRELASSGLMLLVMLAAA